MHYEHSDRMRNRTKPNMGRPLKMTKKANSTDRRIQKKTKKTTKNSKEDNNPFCKKINRHYGSFKVKILGNHKLVFNKLRILEIKPLGIRGSGCRRNKSASRYTG